MTDCWLIPTLIHFPPQSYICCACRTILCSFPQGDMLNPAPWTMAISSCWNVIKLQMSARESQGLCTAVHHGHILASCSGAGFDPDSALP